MRLQNPVYIGLLLLKLYSTAMSVIVFTVYFFLTDWKDEYQMVIFILKYKTFQFFSPGLINTIIVAMDYFECLSAFEVHIYRIQSTYIYHISINMHAHMRVPLRRRR